jgi:hypothetical protein
MSGSHFCFHIGVIGIDARFNSGFNPRVARSLVSHVVLVELVFLVMGIGNLYDFVVICADD